MITSTTLPERIPATAVEVLQGPSARRLSGSTRPGSTTSARRRGSSSSGANRGSRTFLSGPAPLFAPPRAGVDSYEAIDNTLAFLGFYVDIYL